MIKVCTDHPVALNSPDHLHPWGTAHDNSRSPGFNDKLIALVPEHRRSILDLGCAGGAMVLDYLNEGWLAVGLEGSDYSQKTNRSEWCNIGGTHLFTADVTQPFSIFVDDRPAWFQVITLWEVLEHIAEPDLEALFDNIAFHLDTGGLVIGSVSTREEAPEGFPLHQTVQERDWWLRKFWQLGFVQRDSLVGYFGNDMVRVDGDSFYVVLTRRNEAPIINGGVL